VLAEIADAHHATPHAIVLAFLCREEGIFAIPKSSRVEHVEANATAGSLTLSDDEIARIDAAFPRGRPRPLPMI
jgi:diketogulonate reductase-like aldo/keto reductase